jgi:hypothetical protein
MPAQKVKIVQEEIPYVILQANIVLLISASLYHRDITPQEKASPYHAMRMPARAHVQRHLLEHVTKAIPALMMA